MVRPCLEGGARTQEKALGAALQAEEEPGEGQKREEEPRCRFVETKLTEGPKASAPAVRIPGRVGGPECTCLNAPRPLLQEW